MGRRHPPAVPNYPALLPEDLRAKLGLLTVEIERLHRYVLDAYSGDPAPHHILHRPDRSEDPLDTAVPSADVDGDPPTKGVAGTLLRSDAKLRLGITTTKGDLIVRSTKNTRLGVGANGQVLIADSAQPTGVKWDTSVGTPTWSRIFLTMGA